MMDWCRSASQHDQQAETTAGSERALSIPLTQNIVYAANEDIIGHLECIQALFSTPSGQHRLTQLGREQFLDRICELIKVRSLDNLLSYYCV
jgi:hypothetical protein